MKLLTALILSLIIYGLAGFMDLYVAENVNFKEVNAPPLYDVIHSITKVYLSITNLNRYMLFIIITFLLRWLFIGDKRIIVLFFLLTAIIYCFRVFTFTATQTPPPETHHEHACPRQSLSYILRGSFSSKYAGKMCMDNMFSGHASTMLIILFLTLKYSPYMLEKIYYIITSFILLFFVITTRIHYTSDVIVAIIICSLLFLAFPQKYILSKITT